MTDTTLVTADGLTLEHRWDGEGDHVVVFCHPHPQHGGTMTAPLMESVTGHLVEAGLKVLRFNYRGVGASEGAYAHGIGELDDVEAAMALARTSTLAETGPRVSLAGWSFGAAMGLRWQAREGDTSTYVGIAPPAGRDDYSMPSADDLAPATRAILIGERDQLIDVAAVREYAASIGASFEELPASDHFFYFREARVAKFVLSHL